MNRRWDPARHGTSGHMSALISGGVHSRRGFGSGPLRRVLALKGQAISQMLHVYLVLAASPAARSKRPKIARPSPGGSGLLRPSASSTPRPARQPESAEGDNRRAFACVDRAITTNTDPAVRSVSSPGGRRPQLTWRHRRAGLTLKSTFACWGPAAWIMDPTPPGWTATRPERCRAQPGY